jgi:hypothetical protein
MRLGDAGVKKDSVGLHTAGEFRCRQNSAGVVPTTLPVTIFFCLKGSCLLSKIMKKDITYYRFQLPPACQT